MLCCSLAMNLFSLSPNSKRLRGVTRPVDILIACAADVWSEEVEVVGAENLSRGAEGA